jgi:hypothetical protein
VLITSLFLLVFAWATSHAINDGLCIWLEGFGMVSCLIARGKAVTQAEFQRIVKMHPSAHFIREVCPCPLHHVQFILQRVIVNRDYYFCFWIKMDSSFPLWLLWQSTCSLLNLQVLGHWTSQNIKAISFFVLLCDDNFPVCRGSSVSCFNFLI